MVISSDLLVALPATEALECWGGLDMVRSRGAQARRWNAPGTQKQSLRKRDYFAADGRVATKRSPRAFEPTQNLRYCADMI